MSCVVELDNGSRIGCEEAAEDVLGKANSNHREPSLTYLRLETSDGKALVRLSSIAAVFDVKE